MNKNFFDIRILSYQRKDGSAFLSDKSYYSIELSESPTDDVFAILRKRGYVAWNGEVPFRLIYRSNLKNNFPKSAMDSILAIIRDIKKIPDTCRCVQHQTKCWVNYKIHQLDEYLLKPSDDDLNGGFEYQIFIQLSQARYTFYEKDQQIVSEKSSLLALHLCGHAVEFLRNEQKNNPIEYLMMTSRGETENQNEEIFTEIANQKKLRGVMIRFYENEKITARLVKKLMKLPKLEVLTLENIDSDALEIIKEMRNLKGLRLEYHNAHKTDNTTEFDFLCDMSSLEYLDLRHCDINTGTLRMPPNLKYFVTDNVAVEKKSDKNMYSDKRVFSFLSSGKTNGILYGGLEPLAASLPLKNIDELRDLSALYRPGIMQKIERYLKNEAPHIPEIEEITKETRNIVLYVDQKDRIAQKITGCSLEEAKNFRVNLGILITPLFKYFVLLSSMHMGITYEDAKNKYYGEWGDNVYPRTAAEKIAQKIYREALKYVDAEQYNKGSDRR